MSLLKAMLIASTTAVTYGYDTNDDVVTLSDYYAADGSGSNDDGDEYALGTDGVDYHQVTPCPAILCHMSCHVMSDALYRLRVNIANIRP